MTTAHCDVTLCVPTAPPKPCAHADTNAIEEVFQRHMQRSLASYQSLLAELNSRMERRVSDCVASFSKQLDELRASHRVIEKMVRYVTLN